MFRKRKSTTNSNKVSEVYKEIDYRNESEILLPTELESHLKLDKRKKITFKTESREILNDTGNISKIVYESDYNLGIGRDYGATAIADYDCETDHDHRAVLERNESIGNAIAAGELEDGIYRGLGANRTLIKRREGAISSGKHSGLFGPVRGNKYVRMTMRIDLNPEICKDYKETGYCGFGDTCIFLHDRSDYKPGWLLEKEWEQEQKIKQLKDQKRLKKLQEVGDSTDLDCLISDSSDSDNPSERNELPSSCNICNNTWTTEDTVIVTQCNHYFCESCALKHYGESPKCFECGEPTSGIFNTASIIMTRLRRNL